MNGWQIALGVLLAGVVSGSAYKLKMLNRSGALAAALLGAAVFGLGGLDWAVILLLFFGTSSGLSLLFKYRKSGAEQMYEKGSRRDAGQVLANGGIAGLCVIWHVISPESALPWMIFSAAFAAANADTWATELGVLNKRKPVMVFSRKPVDAGTSGAMSPTGTSAALGGALLIGITAAWLGANNQNTGINITFWQQTALITAGGFLGSLVDSILGGTVQAIYYCSRCEKETEKHPLHGCGSKTDYLRGLKWMNNDLVNLICTSSAALSVLLFLLFLP